MLEKLKHTAKYLQERVESRPEAGIILGTGIGGLASEIEDATTIPYDEIPCFPVSTVEGHHGNLIFGKLMNRQVVAMQGRFHYYEGHDMQQIAFPVRVMKLLGISTLFLTNSCGGVNPDFEIGDVMIINDHINLFPSNPLIVPNIDALGPRFPDMSEPYDLNLISKAEAFSKENELGLRRGVYAGLPGPMLETSAEYNFVRIIGADAVGMSTVPEVIAARHMGIRCFGMAVITDLGVPGKMQYITHEMVQEVATASAKNVMVILRHLINSL